MAKKRIVGLILAIVAVMIIVKGAECRLIKIGARGWVPDYNYTEWLNQQEEHFYVGDWLYFVFDKHYFNVLEVNMTSYESCNEEGFIFNVTRGGRDVYQLKEARQYCFLSSGGYCWKGMKIAISVEPLPPPTPAPTPPPKNASSQTQYSSTMILLISFYVALFRAILRMP